MDFAISCKFRKSGLRHRNDRFAIKVKIYITDIFRKGIDLDMIITRLILQCFGTLLFLYPALRFIAFRYYSIKFFYRPVRGIGICKTETCIFYGNDYFIVFICFDFYPRKNVVGTGCQREVIYACRYFSLRVGIATGVNGAEKFSYGFFSDGIQYTTCGLVV